MRLFGPILAVLGLVLILPLGCSTVLGVDFGAAQLATADASVPNADAATDAPPPPPSCTPKTCSALGFACGTQNDGCGNAIDCGACSSGLACAAGKCNCVPTTCPALGATCGTKNDGCGGALDCGSCADPSQACVSGKCVCQPKTCAAQGAECGTVPDGCGGTYDCGMCQDPKPICGGAGANKCGASMCVPSTCVSKCGSVSDGCGNTLTCGGCTAPATCGGAGMANVCGCAPTTCAQAGKNCGSIPDACGGTLSCGTCTSPETCGGGGTSGICGCTPTTCAALGKTCGAVGDGCGNNLDCGTCTSPNTCGGGGTSGTCGCISVAGSCSSCCGSGKDSCGRPCFDNACCNPCFPADTPIAMADGTSKSIQDVRVGEWVKSFDPSTRAIVATQVTAALTHPLEESLGSLVIINESVAATPNHPFLVDGRSVRADSLRVGDHLVRVADGIAAPIDDSVHSVRSVAARVVTYDIRVGAPGTFLAGGVIAVAKP